MTRIKTFISRNVSAGLLILSFIGGFVAGACYEESRFIDDHCVLETYTVKPGDTFWDITERYCNLDERHIYILEYQDEVRALNPELAKRHCQVRPGDVIKIKYLKD